MINYLVNFNLGKRLIDFYFILLLIQVLGFYTFSNLYQELLIFIIIIHSAFEVVRSESFTNNTSLLYLFLTPSYFIMGLIIYQDLNVTFLKDLSLFLIFLIVYEKNYEDLLSYIINLSYKCLPICLIGLLIEVSNVEFTLDSFRDIQNRNVSVINYAYILIIINPFVKTNHIISLIKYVFFILYIVLCIKTITITGLIITFVVLMNDIYRFNKKISFIIFISVIAIIFSHFSDYLYVFLDRFSGDDFIYSQNPRIYEILYFLKNINYFSLFFGLGIGSVVDNPFYSILPNVTSDKIDMIHFGYFHLIMKGGLIMIVTYIILQYRVLKSNINSDMITFMIVLNVLILSHQRFNLSIISLLILLLLSVYKTKHERNHFKY